MHEINIGSFQVVVYILAGLPVSLSYFQAAWAADTKLILERRLEDKGPDGRDIPGHREAVEQARRGDAAGAANALSDLREAHPENVGLLYDYIAVLSWADRHAEAVSAAKGLLLDTAPAYLLEAVARSARATGDLAYSLSAYDALLSKTRGNAKASLGKALVLIEAGAHDKAEELLAKLSAEHPGDADIFDAWVSLETARGDWFRVLAMAEKALGEGRFAERAGRARTIALWRLGAPHLAWKGLEKSPGYLGQEARRAIERDKLAYEVRWGSVHGEIVDGPSRHEKTDEAIAESERFLQRLAEAGADEDVMRVRFDHIVALGNRLRSHDVVHEFEKIGSAPAGVPPYVRITAGLAYLNLERPHEACALLSEALKESPDNFQGQLGLFYALLESGDYSGALLQIDTLLEKTRPWLIDYGPAGRKPNPNHLRALIAAAMARSYTDRPAEAEARLDMLADSLPANKGIRNSRAEVWQARGWPRRAAAEQDWLLGADPGYIWARLGRFHSSMQMQEYAEAESALRLAETEEPDLKPVHNARHDWETHNRRQLIVETSLGHGSGGQSGDRDSSLDAHLYSAPLSHHWRAYARYRRDGGSFDTGRISREIAGGGAEYRGAFWSGSIEGRAGRQGASSIGFALTMTPDDHWSLGLQGENRSLETPLRAYDAGIHAHRLATEIAYRWSESRRAALGLARMGFDDGNRRNSISASLTERFVTGPVYKLDVTAALYGSSNSRDNAPYFNPRNDRALGFTLDNQWLAWRFYRASWRHRLVLTMGSYRQSGFGSGNYGAIRYETAWAPSDLFELLLGVARSWHPYDGVRETRNGLYGSMNWRF